MRPDAARHLLLGLRLVRGFFLLLAMSIALAAPFVRSERGSPWTLLAVGGGLLLGTEVAYRLVLALLRRVGVAAAVAPNPFTGLRARPAAGPGEAGAPSHAQRVLTAIIERAPAYPAQIVAATGLPLAEVEDLVAALARHGGVVTDEDGRWSPGPRAPRP